MYVYFDRLKRNFLFCVLNVLHKPFGEKRVSDFILYFVYLKRELDGNRELEENRMYTAAARGHVRRLRPRRVYTTAARFARAVVCQKVKTRGASPSRGLITVISVSIFSVAAFDGTRPARSLAAAVPFVSCNRIYTLTSVPPSLRAPGISSRLYTHTHV